MTFIEFLDAHFFGVFITVMVCAFYALLAFMVHKL